jgi:hypothetical protein
MAARLSALRAGRPLPLGIFLVLISVKPVIDCARMPRAAVRARQTLSFVYALIIVFVSSIEARQPRAAVDRRCSSATRPSQLKEHSTLKSLCRGTTNRSDLARHAPSLQCSFCRARQNGIDFARQSNKHCLARQPRAIGTRL